MKTSWKKVMLIAAPLLVIAGGASYAMTGGTSTQVAEGATNVSNVSAQVVSSQALTTEEAAQLGSAKPAPVTATSAVDQATLDANNPFLIEKSPEPSATGVAPTATTTAPATPVASNFQVNLVKDMAFETNTTQGKLKVEFKQEDGMYKLQGDLAGRKLDLRGEQALQIMNQLLSGYHLQDALTATLQGKQVHLDPNVLNAVQTLNVELQDGRKIESKGRSGKSKDDDKASHDNGLHKGQVKQAEKDKGKKHDD